MKIIIEAKDIQRISTMGKKLVSIVFKKELPDLDDEDEIVIPVKEIEFYR